jgi:guanine deaminase
MKEDDLRDPRVALARAIDLATRAVESGSGGPFGALVVREGRVLGEAHNEVVARCDPTAHAEVMAIRRACEATQSFSLAGATIYASCEPCPMCLGAIHWARLDRVYFAAGREDAAAAGFDDAVLYAELTLPLAERRVPAVELRIPHARLPFELWAKSPSAAPY